MGGVSLGQVSPAGEASGGGNGGTGVGVDSDGHADVATDDGGDGADDESKRSEPTMVPLPHGLHFGSPGRPPACHAYDFSLATALTPTPAKY